MLPTNRSVPPRSVLKDTTASCGPLDTRRASHARIVWSPVRCVCHGIREGGRLRRTSTRRGIRVGRRPPSGRWRGRLEAGAVHIAHGPPPGAGSTGLGEGGWRRAAGRLQDRGSLGGGGKKAKFRWVACTLAL